MSFNLLPVRLVDTKNLDTLSEISESGTATSEFTSNWGSREDLRDFVTKHGFKDITDLFQDRFRVDRKKLEQMLSGDNDALIPADVFFAKIMEDTDTYITWPNKLKLGAKSKKDPHVRIAGKQEDVEAAKNRIMSVLYTRCNRVTMKMDISYTDHSHIIGKGGYSIKRVMEETQCHVHFPDSNRSNPTEKSNQVSISGDLEGVECARSRVRELIPLIFGFEPPIMAQNINNTSPYVIKIQEQYKVQVMFKTRSKLHATIVLIKGVEWEVEQVKQATLCLMKYMCDNLINQIPVQMSIQIPPQHHQTVLGKNHSNLKTIMQFTNCQIMFPDAQDQNIPSLKKSNVSISGNIHNVYKARQLLIGSLPLLIIFDLPEENGQLRIRTEQLAEIQTNCDVTVNVRQKAKQMIKACIIKGVEKHATNIYRARNLILGIEEPPIAAVIPSTYYLFANENNNAQQNQSASNFSPNSDLLTSPLNLNNIPSPASPLCSPMFAWHYPPNASAGTSGQPISPFMGAIPKGPYLYNVLHQNAAASGSNNGNGGYHNLGLPSNTLSAAVNNMQSSTDIKETSTISSISSNGSSSMSGLVPSPRSSISPRNYKSYNEVCMERSEQSSGFCEMMSQDNSKKKPERLGSASSYGDYEAKRLSGLQAMQSRPNPGIYRVPTNTWSGYGISNTSPAGFGKKDDFIWKSSSTDQASSSYHGNNVNSNSSTSATVAPSTSNHNGTPSTSTSVAAQQMSTPNNNLNTSNILDDTPLQILNRVVTSNWSDLPSLFNSLGLDRYVTLFMKNEVDLSIFATLSDKDLLTIGVTAFGSRKKMLLAISELNKRSVFCSAAPGAERKRSVSSNSPSNGRW